MITLSPGQQIDFDYVNYKGNSERRSVKVRYVEYGSTQWHPEPQFLLRAYDIGRGEERLFAMKDMTNVEISFLPKDKPQW